MNHAALARGIAQELRNRGYNVEWQQATDDHIVIGIDFIGNKETPWMKAFSLDAPVSSANLFQAMIEGWKADVRKDHFLNQSSETVIAVIGQYGVKAFQSAMKERIAA